ncbi:MAG: hypothetical protein QCH99_01150 [Candidatus Bathyarchaeota archaeon]|nr:hypothetical protein [Candidatus Bathyarchaeum tardum]WGM89342.1 MAG: hypothetical protein NUK63_10625 [Candidatus Bathyarchaeum tardum]
MLFLYSIGRWLLFVVLAIINGSLRNFVYASKVGEQKGHMISSVVAVCYTLAVTYLFVIATKSTATLTELLFIGAFWVTITLLFEFGFGHYVIGHSWGHLIVDYNFNKMTNLEPGALNNVCCSRFLGVVLNLS